MRAVLSLGYGVSAAVVDSNVSRVYRRVFQRSLPTRPTNRSLQEIAEALIREVGHREFNLALLDLGGTVCRYAGPRCWECPVYRFCDFATQPRAIREVAPPHPSPLREIRLRKQISLAELARRSRVSKHTIVDLEHARTIPRPDTLRKLAECLDVGPADLITWSDPSILSGRNSLLTVGS